MSLRWAAVTAIGALFAAIVFGRFAGAASLVDCDTAGAGLDERELQMLALVNEARARAGVPALRPSAALNQAAAWMSEDMVRSGRFSHIDSLGRDPNRRARDCGYPYGAGENIAKGSTSPQLVFDLWMASPGHRANILASVYVVVGIGHVSGAWTLNFGAVDDSSGPDPSPSPTPSPTNTATPTPRASPTATPTPNPPGEGPMLSLLLWPGFNLVTYAGAPAPPPDALASLAGSVTVVYTWDAASQTWLRFIPEAPSWVNTLERMEPGLAYFIGLRGPAVWQYRLP